MFGKDKVTVEREIENDDKKGSAFGKFVLGLLLFIGAFPVLFSNEGRAVQTERSLEEGQGLVVSVKPSPIDPSNEGKLVHISGTATSEETPKDVRFLMSADGAWKLERRVEMYQWVEREKTETKKKGKKKVEKTTYTYDLEWSNEFHDSNLFHDYEGHENPDSMPYMDETFTVESVKVGDFSIPKELWNDIGQEAEVVIPETLPAELAKLGDEFKNATVVDGYLYLSDNPLDPSIGDIRISFRAWPLGDVSVIGQQQGSNIAPYQTESGDALLMLQNGIVGADLMFQAAQDENAMMTWIFRFLGFLMMFFGLRMAFGPIVRFVSAVPVLGSAVDVGVGIFSFLVSAALSTLTISVAWIFFRPLLGITLLVLAVGGIAALVALGRKRGAARAAAAA